MIVHRMLVTASRAGAAAGIAATAAFAPNAAAAPGPVPGAPSAVARSHGIRHVGDATMGWRSKTARLSTTSGASAGPMPAASQIADAGDSRTLLPSSAAAPQTAGLDISNFTPSEPWAAWKSSGVRFAYIKASEGNYYTSPAFNRQYTGASTAHVIRGAYHFANPSVSGGAAQADYFINHGGGWSPDGQTLPGALDMEWNPYSGNACYDKTPAQLQQFVTDFTTRYKARTGTSPIIYTASSWWNTCMGTSTKWATTPLWIADYRASLGSLPAAWSGTSQTIWQNAEHSDGGYDTDVFNGSQATLASFATKGAR